MAAADPRWLLLAFGGFVGSLVATAQAWRTAMASCGGRIGPGDACARYGVGSLVNSFLPGRLGEAVRVGLFSRVLPGRQAGRTLTTVGVLAAVTVADALTQTGAVGAATAVVPVPRWALAAGLGVLVAVAVIASVAARRARSGRVARLFDVFAKLAQAPARALLLFAWLAAATIARVAAAIAIAASLGVAHPLQAGVTMCALVIVATAVPLTPGNLGVTSAAAALALHLQGVSIPSAIAAGLAFHAVELLAGVIFGAAGAFTLLPFRPRIALRRRALASAALLSAVGVAAGTGMIFLDIG